MFPQNGNELLQSTLNVRKKIIQFPHFNCAGKKKKKKKKRFPTVIAAPTLPGTDSWLQGLCFKRRALRGENTL